MFLLQSPTDLCSLQQIIQNNDIIHLYPQLWWELLKRHCGLLKSHASICLWPSASWVGITEVFLCCVNLSSSQTELECERDLHIEENLCFKVQKHQSKCLPLSLGQLAGLEELRQACVNLSLTQKELECERGKDRAGHVAVENRALVCK